MFGKPRTKTTHKRLTPEERAARQQRRLQLYHLNALIMLKAGVTVDTTGDDGEPEGLRLTSIAHSYTRQGEKFTGYYWKDPEKKEEHTSLTLAVPRFSIGLNVNLVAEQVIHLNKLIEHGNAVSIEVEGQGETPDVLWLTKVRRAGDQFEVFYRVEGGMASRLVSWMTFFDISLS